MFMNEENKLNLGGVSGSDLEKADMWYCFVLESWTYILCINDLAKTKEKAEAKLKELQYA